MLDFNAMLQHGNAWLFFPSAIVLGALHGLEPGHSKTMMAAFIVAVRGTLTQAVLLGLAATVSHTAVVWAVAMVGLHFGGDLQAESIEPYFQVASGVVIVLVAVWMLARTWHGQHHDHDHDHDHGHAHPNFDSLGHDDAHARAHAEDIRKRFANREVTTGQIVLFGLTGGLIPCPASITVLLICLQLKKVALGATLVLGFSVGLALTLVASGVIAALGVQHAAKRWHGLGDLTRSAPYVSGALIGLLGLYVGYQGLHALL